MSRQAPRVIIRESGRDELYTRVVEEAAELTGWKPVIFEEVNDTVAAMTEGDAVVTGLGYLHASFGSDDFPTLPILARAAKLGIPVALLSGHPMAADYVREDSQDIYVPTVPYNRIAPQLEAWFRGLVQDPATTPDLLG